MVLPAMVYVPTEPSWSPLPHGRPGHRPADHALQQPPGLSRRRSPWTCWQRLADVPNIVAVKESAPDTRRFTDLARTPSATATS
jgi:hypothetical protein